MSFQQYLNTYFKNFRTLRCVDPINIDGFDFYSSLRRFFVPPDQICLNFLGQHRKRYITKLEPHRVKRKTCFSMLLNNLAEPDWISISCKRRILHWFICTTNLNNKTTDFIEPNLKDKSYYCSLLHAMLDKICIAFHWIHKIPFKNLPCRNEHFISVKKLAAILQSILDAVSYSEDYPVFLFISSSDQLSMYTYERYLNTYYQKVTQIKAIQSEGFYICIKSKNTTFAGGHLFQCNISHYILHSQICNGKIDCIHTEEDEKFVHVINTGISVKKYFAIL